MFVVEVPITVMVRAIMVMIMMVVIVFHFVRMMDLVHILICMQVVHFAKCIALVRKRADIWPVTVSRCFKIMRRILILELPLRPVRVVVTSRANPSEQLRALAIQEGRSARLVVVRIGPGVKVEIIMQFAVGSSDGNAAQFGAE